MSSDESGKEELKYICRECKDSTRVTSDSDLKCIHCNSDLVQEIGFNSSLISIPNVSNASEVEQNERQNICSICLDTIDSNSDENRELINCKHLFHKQCIKEWLMKNMTCPFCRVKVLIDELPEESFMAMKEFVETHRQAMSRSGLSLEIGAHTPRGISIDISDEYMQNVLFNPSHEVITQIVAEIADWITRMSPYHDLTASATVSGSDSE